MKKLSFILLLLFFANAACSAPAPVVRVGVCTDPQTCVKLEPGLSTTVLTYSWMRVNTSDKGKPLVYPVDETGGYTIFLYPIDNTSETVFDIYVPDQPATFDPALPEYKILNVGQYGFKVGDIVCARILVYNTVPVDGTPTRRESEKSESLCIGLSE